MMLTAAINKRSNIRIDFLIVLLVFFAIVMLPATTRAQKILTVAVPSNNQLLMKSFKNLAKRVKDESKDKLRLNIKPMSSSIFKLFNLKGLSKKFDIVPIYSTRMSRYIPGINENFLLNGPYQIRLVLNKMAGDFRSHFQVQYLTAWYMGTYAFVGKQPLNTPAAFKNRKVASTSNVTSLGARLDKTKYNDRAGAFAAGSIAGFETKILNPKLPKLLTPQKGVLTLTNHRFQSAAIFISQARFIELESWGRSILVKAFKEIRAVHNNAVVDKENEFLESLHKTKVVRANVPEFKKLPSVQDRWKGIKPKLRDQIQKVSGSTGCSSSNKCKCKTNKYKKKCTCHKMCKQNNDCKDEA